MLSHGLPNSLIEIASLNPQPRVSHAMCVIPNVVNTATGYDGIIDTPFVDTRDDSSTGFVCDPLLTSTQLIADADAFALNFPALLARKFGLRFNAFR